MIGRQYSHSLNTFEIPPLFHKGTHPHSLQTHSPLVHSCSALLTTLRLCFLCLDLSAHISCLAKLMIPFRPAIGGGSRRRGGASEGVTRIDFSSFRFVSFHFFLVPAPFFSFLLCISLVRSQCFNSSAVPE